MVTLTILALFNRDLNRLKTEIESYKNENRIWLTLPEISNSAGNLCLHLIGNLSTYIGAEIGKTDYIRDRPLEFTLKNIPRTILIEEIEKVILVIHSSFEKLKEADLQNEFPVLVFEKPCSTEYLLIHLSTHLAYHLGQINYHRRLLDK